MGLGVTALVWPHKSSPLHPRQEAWPTRPAGSGFEVLARSLGPTEPVGPLAKPWAPCSELLPPAPSPVLAPPCTPLPPAQWGRGGHRRPAGWSDATQGGGGPQTSPVIAPQTPQFCREVDTLPCLILTRAEPSAEISRLCARPAQGPGRSPRAEGGPGRRWRLVGRDLTEWRAEEVRDRSGGS